MILQVVQINILPVCVPFLSEFVIPGSFLFWSTNITIDTMKAVKIIPASPPGWLTTRFDFTDNWDIYTCSPVATYDCGFSDPKPTPHVSW